MGLQLAGNSLYVTADANDEHPMSRLRDSEMLSVDQELPGISLEPGKFISYKRIKPVLETVWTVFQSLPGAGEIS